MRMGIFAAACTLLACLNGQQKGPLLILRTGTFHHNEVTAQSGERWLGLDSNGRGFSWRAFQLVVRDAHDPVVDVPGEKTGKEVAVTSGNPLFLLKGAVGLAGKKVKTIQLAPQGTLLADKDELPLRCDGCGGSYHIRLVNRKRADVHPPRVSRLLLEHEGLVQVLYEWPEGFIDQQCELVWAGDLDGDGALDLCMNLSDHYNANETTLFLSSKRGKGKLLERIAAFRTIGC